MNDKRKGQTLQDEGFPVHDAGEIFQADLTDENTPSPASREPDAHDLDTEGEETDSQAGDAFMERRYGPHS